MIIETFMKAHGITITVKRSGELDREERGLPNHDATTNRSYIGFFPGTDIKPNDVLVNTSGDKMYVVDVKTDYFRGKPEQLLAFYQTEAEHDASQPASTIFNIMGDAYGVNVGDNNTTIINYTKSIEALKEKAGKTEGPDKESIQRIIELLEMIVDNQLPPSKGLFSKFSEVMERHSWLTNAISSTLLAWLMTNI